SPPRSASVRRSGCRITPTSAPTQPTRSSAIRSPGEDRSRAARPARSSRISGGTSSSPRWATCCPSDTSPPPPTPPPISPPSRTRTACGPMAPAGSCRGDCRHRSSRADMGSPSSPASTRTCRSTARTTAASAATRPNSISTMRITAPRATVPPTCTTSPATSYDYRWTTTLARREKINTHAPDRRASGPDGNGGLVNVAGDFRELQGTMWCHDHRFFFTAENVYKGNVGMVNYYSGPDRGNEGLNDGGNLRRPRGTLPDSGNPRLGLTP